MFILLFLSLWGFLFALLQIKLRENKKRLIPKRDEAFAPRFHPNYDRKTAVTLQPGNDGQSSQFAAPSQVVSVFPIPEMLSAGDISLWTEGVREDCVLLAGFICNHIVARGKILVKEKILQKGRIFLPLFRKFFHSFGREGDFSKFFCGAGEEFVLQWKKKTIREAM